MSFGRFLIRLAIILSLPGCALSSRYFEPEQLHVMLQGKSSEQLSSLVRSTGGSITHDLHLINAIGAKMTRSQLRTVLKSELVTFYIDDLISLETSPEEEEEDDAPCRVRGQIELAIDDAGLDWPLFNKRKEPVTWESLEISWPARLGNLEAATLDGKPLSRELLEKPTETGTTLSTKIEFPTEARPTIEQRAHLRLDFSGASAAMLKRAAEKSAPAKAEQSEFKLVANFAEGCSDKSVPGYANNHEDYYYNTVAGIDPFHREGITGDGITVAVIDSGLWQHPALMLNTRGEPRVLASYDVTTNKLDQNAIDESGHGTHMSSIIAHSGPTLKDGVETGTYKGVAPDANLVAVKVLNRAGNAHILDIAKAVQWVIENREKYQIRVLNISLAQRPRWPYWEDPVTQLVMRAWAAGITVIAAASNDGPELMTIGSPGNLPYIITVGAVTDSWTTDTRDDDYIPDFSSRGPTPAGYVKPDIVALGGHMTGLSPPGSDLTSDTAEDVLGTGELVSTGSSQSAALVSGIVALLLQLEPELSPDDIKCKLITSAEPAINADGTLAYSPFEQGFGHVSAPRAVTLGETGCGNSDLDLLLDIEGIERYYGPAVFDQDGTPGLPGFEAWLSDTPSAKGLSDTRKWGVKAHIERLDGAALKQVTPDSLLYNWLEIYERERMAVEALSKTPPD